MYVFLLFSSSYNCTKIFLLPYILSYNFACFDTRNFTKNYSYVVFADDKNEKLRTIKKKTLKRFKHKKIFNLKDMPFINKK